MESIKRNGSGYYDPTAYKAIKNADGGVSMQVYRGDIFYVEDNYRTEGSEQRPGRHALVVSNNTGNYHSDIVSIVFLTTQPKKDLPTHCQIMSKLPSIALCEQVVTISQSRLGDYIRTATDAEMKEVDKCLIIALGLTPDVTCNEDDSQIDDLKEEIQIKQKTIDGLMKGIQEAEKEIRELQEQTTSEAYFEVTRLKAQIEILEKQNEKLLDRLIG